VAFLTNLLLTLVESVRNMKQSLRDKKLAIFLLKKLGVLDTKLQKTISLPHLSHRFFVPHETLYPFSMVKTLN
jgi:hypothetical protein